MAGLPREVVRTGESGSQHDWPATRRALAGAEILRANATWMRSPVEAGTFDEG